MIYTFDFDGVLMNSVNECALTCYNAVTGSLIDSFDSLPEGYLQSFRESRCYAHSAGILMALGDYLLNNESPEPLTSESAMEDYVDRLNTPKNKSRKDFILELQSHFFEARRKLVEADYNKWLNLNTVYEPLWSAVLSGSLGKCTIITNKNHQAVINLSHYFGWQIRDEEVFAVDSGLSKVERFRLLRSRYEGESICFIEDSLKNLLSMKAEITESDRLILADWGYICNQDRKDAQEADIELLEINEFVNSARL